MNADYGNERDRERQRDRERKLIDTLCFRNFPFAALHKKCVTSLLRPCLRGARNSLINVRPNERSAIPESRVGLSTASPRFREKGSASSTTTLTDLHACIACLTWARSVIPPRLCVHAPQSLLLASGGIDPRDLSRVASLFPLRLLSLFTTLYFLSSGKQQGETRDRDLFFFRRAVPISFWSAPTVIRVRHSRRLAFVPLSWYRPGIRVT